MQDKFAMRIEGETLSVLNDPYTERAVPKTLVSHQRQNCGGKEPDRLAGSPGAPLDRSEQSYRALRRQHLTMTEIAETWNLNHDIIAILFERDRA
jgi:hypothetical protein